MTDAHSPREAAHGHITIPPIRWRDALAAVNTVASDTRGQRWDSISAAIAGVHHAGPSSVTLADGRAGVFSVEIPAGRYTAPCDDLAAAALSSEIVEGRIACTGPDGSIRAVDTWTRGHWARTTTRG